MAFYLPDILDFIESALKKESIFVLFLCARFYNILTLVLMCVPIETCLVAWLGFYFLYVYYNVSMLKSYFVHSTHCLQLFMLSAITFILLDFSTV